MDPLSEKGFTLIEVVVSMLILTVGVLSLLAVTAVGVQRAGSSSDALIAREKAREAIESVHAARDTGALSWPNIRNVSAGGIFLDGPQPLTLAGADGLVNTADDTGTEEIRSPGADGILGNDDDHTIVLTHFTREIIIGDLAGNTGGINPNLREITVNIRYRVRNVWRTYRLQTYVSSFS